VTASTERATGIGPPSAPVARPGPRRRPRSARRSLQTAIEVLFFVGPALALFLVFVVWPIIRAAQFSLYRWKGFGPLTDFVGLDNYFSVLSNEVFTDAFTHNMVIVVGSVLVQMPLGLAVALLLNRRIRGQGLLRTIVFVPYVLAEVIASVVWLQLLQPQYGVVDSLLSMIGIAGPEQGWLGTPDYALWTVLVVLTWKYLGLAVLLFLAGLQGIPTDVVEAAQIDGASWWQVQRWITVPLLGPTLRVWAFLSMIGSLQLFDMVWILTGGGPANSTTSMATFLVTEGTKRQNYGIAAAASVILFVVALVFALLYQLLVLRRDTHDLTRIARPGVTR
jgi:raffinose/stachyose/melibiose transport system permease protein